MVVLLVDLKVLREVGDTGREDRDLDLWRTCISFLQAELLNDFGLALCSNRHRLILSNGGATESVMAFIGGHGRDVVQPGRLSLRRGCQGSPADPRVIHDLACMTREFPARGA